MSYEGFASLETPRDLLRKVQHDFERLQANPADSYAAFDFFVTAYHLLDWLHRGDEAGRIAEEQNTLLLQVCSHLANGAKHFKVTKKRHQSVNDVAPAGPIFAGGFLGAHAVTIKLDGAAANCWGAEIAARDFAKAVLEFWQADPRLI